VRLSAAVRGAAHLEQAEFQVHRPEGAFRLIIGIHEALQHYFLILQNATISPGFSEARVELRRQIFVDFRCCWPAANPCSMPDKARGAWPACAEGHG